MTGAEVRTPRVSGAGPTGVAAACLILVAAIGATGARPIGGRALSATPARWLLDLNTASAAELELLPGIGPNRAADIIAYRERVGGFRSVNQLSRISGIGPRTIRSIEGFVRVEGR